MKREAKERTDREERFAEEERERESLLTTEKKWIIWNGIPMKQKRERERGNVNLDFGWAIIGLWPELGTYDEKTLPVSLPTASGTLADLFEVLN